MSFYMGTILDSEYSSLSTEHNAKQIGRLRPRPFYWWHPEGAILFTIPSRGQVSYFFGCVLHDCVHA